MSIAEQIMSDIKDAMRAKEKKKLTTLRSLSAEIKKFAIDNKKEATDEEVSSIITKGIKTRIDSAEQYKNANRMDLAEIELVEIEIYRTYQPKQLTAEELEAVVRETVAKVGAKAPSDMGKVMGALMSQVKGKADGKMVNETVKKVLSE